jgi:hypothetical protein
MIRRLALLTFLIALLAGEAGCNRAADSPQPKIQGDKQLNLKERPVPPSPGGGRKANTSSSPGTQ